MLVGTIKKLTMAITERPEVPESYDLQAQDYDVKQQLLMARVRMN
jgi:hypothetical protein